MRPAACVDVEVLRELGEWLALGYYEAIDLPWPRQYGLAMRRLYENFEVTVAEDHYLMPCDALYYPRARDASHYWSDELDGPICRYHHAYGLGVSRDCADRKKSASPQHAEAIDLLVSDLESKLRHFGGYTHSNPDMRRVVNEGFFAIEAELDGELEAACDSGERDLLLGLKDVCVGIRALHASVAKSLRLAHLGAEGERRTKLGIIADSLDNCFLNPSASFLEGLLAVHFAWMLDDSDSIGRFDQALGPLFEKDLADGTLDLEFAREVLDEMWHNFERLNGWNLQLGGRTPDGADGVNALTMECLSACERNRIIRPNVAFRLTNDTSDDVLIRVLEVLGRGSGRPPIYNDDLYIETLLGADLGLCLEDAREIGFGGCTETMIAGMSNVGSLEAHLNLARALDLAIHDGRDVIAGEQAGPHTGKFVDFGDFDSFLGAVKRQIVYLNDVFVSWSRTELSRRFHEGDPKLIRTLFTRDCVKNRKSFEAGGARYNWSLITYEGTGNLIDSLSAVRKCVFDDCTVGKSELIDALSADFNGYERVREKLAAAPRYGNDDPYVDDIGRDILEFACDDMLSHETPRGGRYIPSCILFATYGWAGLKVGATPDGRLSGQPLNDSIGAVAGRDVNGPTALLNSVTKLPLTKMFGTPVLNVRFQKSVVTSEAGQRAVAALVRTFFEKGGLMIQISVLSRHDMLAAQKEPEKYRDLIVRIGGYSEYFTTLGPDLQETVIARTAHGTD
jgi:trans-4-hydroxy-L-proline dehydratase